MPHDDFNKIWIWQLYRILWYCLFSMAASGAPPPWNLVLISTWVTYERKRATGCQWLKVVNWIFQESHPFTWQMYILPPLKIWCWCTIACFTFVMKRLNVTFWVVGIPPFISHHWLLHIPPQNRPSGLPCPPCHTCESLIWM